MGRALRALFLVLVFSPQAYALDLAVVQASMKTLPSGSAGTFTSEMNYANYGVMIHAPGVINQAFKMDYKKGELAFGIPIEMKFGAEIGAFTLKRTYSVSGVGVERPLYSFHALARLSMNDALSLGAGAYYAMAADPKVPGLSDGEYGIVASIRANFFPKSVVGLVVDARLGVGLSNVGASLLQTLNYNEFMILSGLRFGPSS